VRCSSQARRLLSTTSSTWLCADSALDRACSCGVLYGLYAFLHYIQVSSGGVERGRGPCCNASSSRRHSLQQDRGSERPVLLLAQVHLVDQPFLIFGFPFITVSAQQHALNAATVLLQECSSLGEYRVRLPVYDAPVHPSAHTMHGMQCGVFMQGQHSSSLQSALLYNRLAGAQLRVEWRHLPMLLLQVASGALVLPLWMFISYQVGMPACWAGGHYDQPRTSAPDRACLDTHPCALLTTQDRPPRHGLHGNKMSHSAQQALNSVVLFGSWMA
jgi:hypothetical protein